MVDEINDPVWQGYTLFVDSYIGPFLKIDYEDILPRCYKTSGNVHSSERPDLFDRSTFSNSYDRDSERSEVKEKPVDLFDKSLFSED